MKGIPIRMVEQIIDTEADVWRFPDPPGSPLTVRVFVTREQHEFERLMEMSYDDMFEEAMRDGKGS